MLTISSGTFTAIDMTDAAIHAAIKSGGINPAFVPNMVLRVNLIGVGRFTIAIGTDVYMGIKRSLKRNERIRLYTKQIGLTNAKVFYKEANMWIAAVDAGEAIDKAYALMEKSMTFYMESMQEMSDNLRSIGMYQRKIQEKNPKVVDDILNILNGG